MSMSRNTTTRQGLVGLTDLSIMIGQSHRPVIMDTLDGEEPLSMMGKGRFFWEPPCTPQTEGRGGVGF